MEYIFLAALRGTEEKNLEKALQYVQDHIKDKEYLTLMQHSLDILPNRLN